MASHYAWGMYTYDLSGLRRPYPPHVLTVAAEQARQALRDSGAERRRKRAAGNVELVTQHPQPWVQIDVSELIGAPATFAKAAAAAGREVAAKRAGDAVCVGVREPSIRAYWPRAESLVEGRAEDLTYAKLRLSMPAAAARVERERIRAEAKAKREATLNAKAALLEATYS